MSGAKLNLVRINDASMGLTLFEKVWHPHVVVRRDDGSVLLHVDRHILHELSSQQAFAKLHQAGRTVHSPGLAIATHDHIVSSRPGRRDDSYREGEAFISALRRDSAAHRIRLLDLTHAQQGIVHVIAPELGVALPGTVLVCGDSHTCTVGGLGALAMGIGTSEVEHVLATQTLVARQPKTMRVTFSGRLQPCTFAKAAGTDRVARAAQRH